MNGVPILVEHNSQTLNLKQLATACDIRLSTLMYRYGRGDRGERLTRPADKRFSRRGRRA